MKHSRISLLERAAEVYDFGAALRARAPAAAEPFPAPSPAEAPVEPADAEETLELSFAAPAVEAPRPTGPRAVATIDRVRLAEAGHIVPEAVATGLAEEFRLVKRRLLASIDRLGTLPEEKRRSVLIVVEYWQRMA